MFPSSLRFFWSLQFSTGSLRGYPRVVPSWRAVRALGPASSGLSAAVIWVLFLLLHISSTTCLFSIAGPSFLGGKRGKCLCLHTARSTREFPGCGHHSLEFIAIILHRHETFINNNLNFVFDNQI